MEAGGEPGGRLDRALKSRKTLGTVPMKSLQSNYKLCIINKTAKYERRYLLWHFLMNWVRRHRLTPA